MRVVGLFAMVAVMLATPGTAVAQEACEGATTTALMRRCAEAKLERAEMYLNGVLEDYRASVRADRLLLLERSQELWEQHRTGYCRFVSSKYEGGSLRPVVELTCRQEVTEARTDQLQQQLEIEEEGDPPEEGVGDERGPTARNKPAAACARFARSGVSGAGAQELVKYLSFRRFLSW